MDSFSQVALLCPQPTLYTLCSVQMLHVDTLQSIVDALVYLQYYLHKVTKQQNNSKANINNTLSALTTYSDLA